MTFVAGNGGATIVDTDDAAKEFDIDGYAGAPKDVDKERLVRVVVKADGDLACLLLNDASIGISNTEDCWWLLIFGAAGDWSFVANDIRLGKSLYCLLIESVFDIIVVEKFLCREHGETFVFKHVRVGGELIKLPHENSSVSFTCAGDCR